MQYFVTIYIDPMDFSIPHTFLELTRKHPDELDKIDDETRLQKLKNANWKNFDKKWYENLETNEYNDGFWGFETGGDDTGLSKSIIGKVFSNNHYVL